MILSDVATLVREVRDLTFRLVDAKRARDEAIWRARREYGFGPTEIASIEGLTLPNVRRIIEIEDARRGQAP